HLGKRLKALYAASPLARDMPIQDLAWDYPVEGAREEPSAQAVLKEINGYTVADRKQVAGYEALRDDGSTACGCWIYPGVFHAEDRTLARSRRPDGPGEHTGHQGWAFAWPANRRTLYNRASADPSGKPWSERKKMIWWDEARREWTGFDRPDFEKDKPPD